MTFINYSDYISYLHIIVLVFTIPQFAHNTDEYNFEKNIKNFDTEQTNHTQQHLYDGNPSELIS